MVLVEAGILKGSIITTDCVHPLMKKPKWGVGWWDGIALPRGLPAPKWCWGRWGAWESLNVYE